MPNVDGDQGLNHARGFCRCSGRRVGEFEPRSASGSQEASSAALQEGGDGVLAADYERRLCDAGRLRLGERPLLQGGQLLGEERVGGDGHPRRGRAVRRGARRRLLRERLSARMTDPLPTSGRSRSGLSVDGPGSAGRAREPGLPTHVELGWTTDQHRAWLTELLDRTARADLTPTEVDSASGGAGSAGPQPTRRFDARSLRRAPQARPDRAAPCACRGGRVVVDRRPDARDGRRALDRARRARLVPRRLGRDDGRDDVPVGRADGRAVRAA